MAELAVLDVGHGSAAVLHDGHRAIVVDAGPGTALLGFIEETGISHIEAVLISHADTDHLKGLVSLMDQDHIVIKSVFVNSDAAKKSRQWKALAYSLEERQRSGECSLAIQLTEGMSFELTSDCTVEILAPRPMLALTGPGSLDHQQRKISTNTISAVARVAVHGRSTLLTGDIDEVGLDHLLDSGQNLQADTLVFPHHGGNVAPSSNETKNAEFTVRLIEAVAPETVIFSFGRTKFRNPKPEIVSVVADSGSSVMCTQMSERCCSSTSLSTAHLHDAYATGRQNGVCCAGTVVVTEVGISPSTAAHAAFVDDSAPTALCRQATPTS